MAPASIKQSIIQTESEVVLTAMVLNLSLRQELPISKYPDHICNFSGFGDKTLVWQDIAPPVSTKAMSQNVRAV